MYITPLYNSIDLTPERAPENCWELAQPRILDILILQDKTLFGALEASNIVCWLVNQPIAKLDLFKSPDCRWICETYVEYCYRNSATVGRLVQSPTLQSTISCDVHSDSRGKGIRVSPAWLNLDDRSMRCVSKERLGLSAQNRHEIGRILLEDGKLHLFILHIVINLPKYYVRSV